jgi:hypothetical protein
MKNSIVVLFCLLTEFLFSQIIPKPFKAYVPTKEIFEAKDGQLEIWTEKAYFNEAKILADQIKMNRDYLPKIN